MSINPNHNGLEPWLAKVADARDNDAEDEATRRWLTLNGAVAAGIVIGAAVAFVMWLLILRGSCL